MYIIILDILFISVQAGYNTEVPNTTSNDNVKQHFQMHSYARGMTLIYINHFKYISKIFIPLNKSLQKYVSVYISSLVFMLITLHAHTSSAIIELSKNKKESNIVCVTIHNYNIHVRRQKQGLTDVYSDPSFCNSAAFMKNPYAKHFLK